MQVRNLNTTPKISGAGPLFTSDDVHRVPLAPDSADFNAAVVHFGPGVRNKFHYHASDQLLVVTEGVGKVVTKAGEEVTVRVGDVVFAPAGEEHWHGALEDGGAFAHITVTRKDGSVTQTEQ